MSTINERLRNAAMVGSEAELKAMLREPGCDPLSKGKNGMTALMLTAYHGHEACLRILLTTGDSLAKGDDGTTALMWASCNGQDACVRLLLPVSNAFATDERGKNASMFAHDRGHKILAQFIDAYALAQTEKASIKVAVSARATRKRAAPRV